MERSKLIEQIMEAEEAVKSKFNSYKLAQNADLKLKCFEQLHEEKQHLQDLNDKMNYLLKQDLEEMRNKRHNLHESLANGDLEPAEQHSLMGFIQELDSKIGKLEFTLKYA